jgi:hypothetical protein
MSSAISQELTSTAATAFARGITIRKRHVCGPAVGVVRYSCIAAS